MQKIIDSPSVQLSYDEEREQIIQVWKGYVSSEDFRRTIDETLDLVKNNNVSAILSNAQRQNVVTPEDTKYAAEIMPELFSEGIQRMAFVVPFRGISPSITHQ